MTHVLGTVYIFLLRLRALKVSAKRESSKSSDPLDDRHVFRVHCTVVQRLCTRGLSQLSRSCCVCPTLVVLSGLRPHFPGLDLLAVLFLPIKASSCIRRSVALASRTAPHLSLSPYQLDSHLSVCLSVGLPFSLSSLSMHERRAQRAHLLVSRGLHLYAAAVPSS